MMQFIDSDLLWVYILFGLLISVAWLIWEKHGRNAPLDITPQYNPPNDLSPIEVGYIANGTVTIKDCLSMILYWANAGYLTLVEINKKEMLVFKKKDLPADAKTYEKLLFSGIFNKSETVSVKDIVALVKPNVEDAQCAVVTVVNTKVFKGTFHVTIEKVRKSLEHEYNTNDNTRLYTAATHKFKIALGVMQLCPVALSMFLAFGFSKDARFMVFILSVFLAVSSYMLSSIVKKRVTMSLGSWLCGLTFICIFMLFPLGFNIFIIGNVHGSWVLGVVAAITSLNIAILFIFMNQRTESSSIRLAKILGLKQFIKTAEKQRLMSLMTSNRTYFYYILPYAYVLGMDRVWGKQFENILVTPVSWYIVNRGSSSFSTDRFTKQLAHSMRMIENYSAPPSSSCSSNRNMGSHRPGGGRW